MSTEEKPLEEIIHPVKPVWCDNCEAWHVECEDGCCAATEPKPEGPAIKKPLDVLGWDKYKVIPPTAHMPNWRYMCPHCFRFWEMEEKCADFRQVCRECLLVFLGKEK